MHALFVFAHQDDEIAFAARITLLVQQGATITCVYLTDGEGRGTPSSVRDEESRTVLTRLGVDLARVHFVGSQWRVPDGALVEHLDHALTLLESHVKEPVDEVWCLAWEGGHPDHDASQLVAVAFAAKHGLLDRIFEMPMYYSHPLFLVRMLVPLPVGRPWTARRLGLFERLRHLALCRFYRTQRKTWLVLLPRAVLHLPFEWTRAVDVSRLDERPHAGRLLSERRFGVVWEHFSRHVQSFLTRMRLRGTEGIEIHPGVANRGDDVPTEPLLRVECERRVDGALDRAEMSFVARDRSGARE